jgi:hypothetical protein
LQSKYALYFKPSIPEKQEKFYQNEAINEQNLWQISNFGQIVRKNPTKNLFLIGFYRWKFLTFKGWGRKIFL